MRPLGRFDDHAERLFVILEPGGDVQMLLRCPRPLTETIYVLGRLLVLLPLLLALILLVGAAGYVVANFTILIVVEMNASTAGERRKKGYLYPSPKNSRYST